jgi:hypothetical protein
VGNSKDRITYKQEMSVKISYKNGDDQRSVVLLKDGVAMEVRRGPKTKWAPGEERGSWPSMAVWAATLPAEWDSVSAWKLAKGTPACGGRGFPLSPLLAAFMNSQRATVKEIDAALFSYIEFSRLQRTYLQGPARFDVWLDDYLVVLTGFHPGRAHHVGGLVRTVLKRHILEPKTDIPFLELERADTLVITELWGSEALFSAAPTVKEEPAPVLVVDELPGVEKAVVLPPEVPMGLPVIAGIPMGSAEAEAEPVPAPEPKTELQHVQEVLASVLERLSIPEPRHVKFAIGFLELYSANNWV